MVFLNTNRSFKDVLIGLLKCTIYLLAWLAISFVVAFVSEVLIVLANGGVGTEELIELVSSKSVAITLFSNCVIILAFSVFYKLRKSSLSNATRANPIPIKYVLSAIILGIAFQYIVLLVLNVIPFPDEWFKSLVDTNSSITEESNKFVRYLSVAIIGPITEEIVFRGLLLNKLRQFCNKYFAIVITSVIFGAVHGNPIGFVYAGIVGMVMGWLYIKFDSIIPCALFHISFNLTSLMIQGDGIPIILIIMSVAIAIYEINDIRKYRN